MPLLNTPRKAADAAVAQLSLLGWAIINVAKYRQKGKTALALKWQERMQNRLKVYRLLLEHVRWFEHKHFAVEINDQGYRLRVCREGLSLSQLQGELA